MGSCNGIYIPIPDQWADAISGWAADLADRGRRPSTIGHYVAEARRFGDWCTDDGLAPADVDAARVRAWVRVMRESGLGGRSIAQRLTAVRGLFRYLLQEEVVAGNPAAAVENPRFRKPLPRVLTADQVTVLLDLPRRDGDGFKQRRDAALLRSLAWTGLRASEAAALDWDHLDLTRGAATLQVIDGKGGRDRRVPIADPLVEHLAAYLEVRLPLGSQRAVFVSTRGNRMNSRRIHETVSRYGRRIGARVYPHLLRAGCGVAMIRAGASLAQVRAVLGHVGYDTLVPYTAVAATEARDVLQAISR